ncbi:MAG TPA: hypothetical protein VF576_00090 [Rubricoccaceae bacterium]|jgi:hypothetical protein
MRPLDSYLVAPATHPLSQDGVRRRIAEALRTPAVADAVLAHLRVPKLLRGVVRGYVERALAAVAAWIDPTAPDPV